MAVASPDQRGPKKKREAKLQLMNAKTGQKQEN